MVALYVPKKLSEYTIKVLTCVSSKATLNKGIITETTLQLFRCTNESEIERMTVVAVVEPHLYISHINLLFQAIQRPQTSS